MKRLAKALAGASLALAVGAPAADAGILAFGYDGNGYASGMSVGAGMERAVALNPNGATTLTFTTTRANTLVAVTYNAVCMATGSQNGHIAIRITIDGVETVPRVSGDIDHGALCSPPVEGTTTMYASNSRQTALRVRNAGVHTVRVVAKASPDVNGLLFFSNVLVQD